jgi:hypothetical protein
LDVLKWKEQEINRVLGKNAKLRMLLKYNQGRDRIEQLKRQLAKGEEVLWDR